MKHRVILGLAVLLLASPAFAQKVYIDFDRDYDFDAVKSFAWAPTEETSIEASNPLLHSRMVNAIEHYLTQGDLVEDNDNPDVYVTYHTASKEEMSLNTTNFGYGYPGGWGYGYGYAYGGWGVGMGSSSTTVTTYEVGTLVVDVWDTSSKTLVWRGTATNIMVSDSPEKMGRRIDKALAKIVKKSRSAFEKEKKKRQQ